MQIFTWIGMALLAGTASICGIFIGAIFGAVAGPIWLLSLFKGADETITTHDDTI